jgi:NADH-quinone oxidoreductase subunit C/D
VTNYKQLQEHFADKLSLTGNNQAELTLDATFDLYSKLEKLKNDFGFIMLVDIYGQDLSQLTNEFTNKKFQLTYLLLNMELHFRLRVNVFLDLDKNEVLPSASKLWPSASWCERETFEMFGISFGKESESRLLTSDLGSGFPMRKDFKFEEDATIAPAEPFSFDPVKSKEKYKVNLADEFSIGPVHPGLKGSMKLNLQVEGDDVLQSNLEVGYIHRGIEKSCESLLYSQIIPLTDRLNFYSSAASNIGWTKAIEELVDLEVSDRTKAMRMVSAELSRIFDHAQCIGSMAQSCKTLEPFEISQSIRELVSHLFEQLCGSRVTHSITRIGGMSREIPAGWSNVCLTRLKSLSKLVDELSSYLTRSSLWINRLETTSLNAYDAIAWGITGPNLRACGVNYDIRRVSPYYFYGDIEFEIPLGINGDCYDRYLVRVEEIRQSIKIITQVLDSLPPGKVSPEFLSQDLDLGLLSFKASAGDIYSMTESPNGELGFYIRSDGDVNPYRVKVRTPSFFSAQLFPLMLEGTKSNDAILSLCSMNIVAGEIDR